MAEKESTSSKQYTVSMEGENYSIVEIPHESSAVVRKAKDAFLTGGTVDLDSLVDDLGKVGKFVRLAYNGVTAAGPDHADLQVKVRQIGDEVTNLCDKSAVTVSKFKAACSSVLSDMQSSYEFLTSGLEEVAVETFSSISEVAKEMRIAAEDMAKDFEEEIKNVQDTYSVAMKRRGESENKIREMKRKFEKQKIEQEKQEEARREAEELEAKANEEAEKLWDLEKEALKDGGWSVGVSIFGRFVGYKSAKREEVERYRERRAEQLRLMNENREKRQEALEEIAKCAKKMLKVGEGGQVLKKVAEDALHESIAALFRLSVVMREAANFWRRMETHCKSMAGPTLEKQLNKVMTLDSEKKARFWSSDAFKRGAVNFYSQWIALQGVCSVYMQKIKETQEDLYKYLTENPSYSEAQKSITTLAAELVDEISVAKDDIAKQRKETDDEIKSLQETEL